MATYISLLRYTQQGIGKIKDSPQRIDAAKQVFSSLGAEIKEAYLVMGRYDLVVITEAPDDETAAKASLAVRSQGNVKTETLRAFTEEEYQSIISALP